ncbi:MAG: hypothetical protein DRP15_01720 [Candidatus Aenigmatarchaeota archaeon]|nr:MAG: hypothetical protein DRP15_01720 [Candidatus Aenigmarchaeota archaeon]
MKIFADKELKEEIKTIHFGKVEAGKEKTITVWLYNDSKAILTNLKVKIIGKLPKTEKVEILDAPVTIQPGEASPLVLRWKPSLNFKQALEVTLKITGEEVYTKTTQVQVEEVKEE